MSATESENIETPQVINLSQVSVESVQAGLVRASQTSIKKLNAEEVELQMSAAGSVQAGSFQASESAVGGISTEQATIQDSIIGGIRAETLNFNGLAALTAATNMDAKEIHAFAVVSQEIHVDNVRTGILISREVHGNVTTTLDSRTALLFGLAAGAVSGLIMLTGRLLFGPKK